MSERLTPETLAQMRVSWQNFGTLSDTDAELALDEIEACWVERDKLNKLVKLGNQYAQGLQFCDKEYAKLKKEIERLRAANESARVCSKHTDEFVGDGCLICDNERLRAAMREALERLDTIGAEDDSSVKILREALEKK